MLDWCADLGVHAVTLWVFSTDNLDRPIELVSGILAAIEAKVRSFVHHPIIHDRRVRVRAMGSSKHSKHYRLRYERHFKRRLSDLRGHDPHHPVAYGGRDEIVEAVRALLGEQIERGLTLPDAVEEISRQAIARHLYIAGTPDPDLIIRTSGEIRLSGFLLWQSTYSEFYFCDVPWPAFRRADFLRAVRSYQQRKRRFGR